jgi:hypothetical protein
VCAHASRKEKRDAPLFVAVYESRRHGTDVRAGADEEENDEQQGLEVEERGLKCHARTERGRDTSVSSARWVRWKKKDGPWGGDLKPVLC